MDRDPEDDRHEEEDEEKLKEREHQVGKELSQDDGDRRGRRDHELFECAALPLPDDREGGEQRSGERQQDRDEARDQEVGAARVGVEEEDAGACGSAGPSPRRAPPARPWTARSATPLAAARRLRRDRRVRAVDQDQDVGRLAVRCACGRNRAESRRRPRPCPRRWTPRIAARERRPGHDVEVARVDEVRRRAAGSRPFGSGRRRRCGRGGRWCRSGRRAPAGRRERASANWSVPRSRMICIASLRRTGRKPLIARRPAAAGTSPRCSIWSLVRRTNTSSSDASIGPNP